MRYYDKMKIVKNTMASDGQGGFTKTWAVTRSDIDCKVRQLNAEEITENAKLSVRSTHRAYCSDVDIAVSDMLYVIPYGETVSDVFEIEAIDQRRDIGSGHKKHMQVDLLFRD